MLFERIESEDHSAITGLPLIGLTGILRTWGMLCRERHRGGRAG